MNKIKAFKNAKEFNELFGIQEHGNGKKSRRNKILLEFYKAKSIWYYCRTVNGKYDYFFSIRNMATLKDYITEEIINELCQNVRDDFNRDFYPVKLMGRTYYSSLYSTDENNGIPSNGDVGFVRYVTHEENRNNKVYKMRAGRFYKRLLLESALGRALPEQVLNWLCEQFTEAWSSYVTRMLPKFTLHVDDNFKRIYSYGNLENDVRGCTCDFGSCMMDDEQWQYYRDCVKAKAAYLTNAEDYVIARCIIFTDVKDEDGNTWRLAERQYAEGGRDLYKRCLVDALIEGGHIDGYKQVGVDCHSTTSYVDKDGNSLMDKEFSIECFLDFSKNNNDAWEKGYRRILSYQDSFKFYDFKENKSYNTEPEDMDDIALLDTTSSYLEGYWSEYDNGWCVNYLWVYVKGSEIKCAMRCISDFIEYNGYYIHKDDFVKCPVCGSNMPDPKYYFHMSFMHHAFDGETEHYVCCRACEYKLTKEFEDKMFYDQIRSRYVKKDTDKPVYILNLYSGCIEGVSCSASQFNNYVENRIIAIVLDENGNPQPMYSRGLSDPQKYYDMYNKESPCSMARMINTISVENNRNEVSILYNNNVCVEENV